MCIIPQVSSAFGDKVFLGPRGNQVGWAGPAILLSLAVSTGVRRQYHSFQASYVSSENQIKVSVLAKLGLYCLTHGPVP